MFSRRSLTTSNNSNSSDTSPARVTPKNPENASYATAPKAPASPHACVAGFQGDVGSLLNWAPEKPVVGGAVLSGPQLSFPDFVRDHDCQVYCRSLFGGRETAAGLMMLEFLKGNEFHYFGISAGKLDAEQSETKRALEKYVQRAYQGDPHKRGIAFWRAISKLVWQAYETLMSLRKRAQRIAAKNIKHQQGLPAKRAKRAAYMRARRAGKHARSTTTKRRRATGQKVKTQT